MQGQSTDQAPAWCIAPAPDWNERITRYIAAWDYILEAIGGDCPKTVSEWSEKQKACLNAPAAPHMSPDYLRPWTVRSYLLSQMVRCRVPAIRIDPACTVNMIIHMNPDVKGSLTRVRSRLSVTEGLRGVTARTFMRRLGNGRPELASMWLCFALDRGFSDFDENFDPASWTEAAKQLLAEQKVHPHPAAKSLVLKSCTV